MAASNILQYAQQVCSMQRLDNKIIHTRLQGAIFKLFYYMSTNAANENG